jgi:hypothetical protein
MNNFHVGDIALWYGFLVEIREVLPSKHQAYIHCCEHSSNCNHYAFFEDLIPVPSQASDNQIKALKTLTDTQRI